MGKTMCTRLFFVMLLFIGTCQAVFAQPGDPDEPVPITGIEILLGIGGALGAKRIIDSRRNKK